jgi:hypothetical protein
MMKPQALPRELAVQIEQAEVRAWEDFYDAAPAALSAALRLGIDRLGETVFTLCPPIPFTLFNRAINLGIAEPATEAQLDALIERYRAQGVANFCIHHAGQRLPVRAQWAVHHGRRLAVRTGDGVTPAAHPDLRWRLAALAVHRLRGGQLRPRRAHRTADSQRLVSRLRCPTFTGGSAAA